MNWLEKLDQQRFHAELILLEEGPLADQAEQLGFRVHVLPAGRLRQPLHFHRTVRAIRGIIRSSEAKLVVSWSPKPHMYGAVAAWLEKVPAIWWQHSMPSTSLFDKWVSRLPAHAVMCPSAVVAEAQQRLSRRQQVVVQHPGIPMDDFRFDSRIRDSIRSQFGISDTATVFAFIGRLQRWKRADVVIQAFRDALKGEDACLFIVGGSLFGVEDELENELRKLVQEEGLASQVFFTGHQSRIEPYLWASDVLVHSSLFEPFGMVILEAMASGRIVLAVNRGGPAEIIRDGVDGLLYDGSARQLTILMRRIRDEKSRYERLGAAAVHTVSERFASPVMTERFARYLTSAFPR